MMETTVKAAPPDLADQPRKLDKRRRYRHRTYSVEFADGGAQEYHTRLADALAAAKDGRIVYWMDGWLAWDPEGRQAASDGYPAVGDWDFQGDQSGPLPVPG